MKISIHLMWLDGDRCIAGNGDRLMEGFQCMVDLQRRIQLMIGINIVVKSKLELNQAMVIPPLIASYFVPSVGFSRNYVLRPPSRQYGQIVPKLSGFPSPLFACFEQ